MSDGKDDPKAKDNVTTTVSGVDNDTDSTIFNRSEELAPEAQHEVTSLARRMTNISLKQQHLSNYENPFGEQQDPTMDPRSGKFDYQKWIRTLLHVTSRDPDKYPRRTAGISFANLNVHGYGNSTDHQKTVGNVLLDLPRTAVNQLGGGKGRRIDILRNFEGLVKDGEMLVVLGPPGRSVFRTFRSNAVTDASNSGCTTLLKTISGETHGFYVDEDAKINYQGACIVIFIEDMTLMLYCRYPMGSDAQGFPR